MQCLCHIHTFPVFHKTHKNLNPNYKQNFIHISNSTLLYKSHLHSVSALTLTQKMAIFLYFFLLISSVSAGCERCFHQSKAAYFASNVPQTHGACGYGALAPEISNGYFGGAVSSLFREGVGCGACFQIRCKDATICNKEWTKVTLTDHSPSNVTDFVLSGKAFLGMARKGMGRRILGSGIVDVEYKRVPCVYKNHNLSVRVEEISKKPHFLAIKFLYQGGQTDINVVDVFEANTSRISFMTRNYGAVWATDRVPAGPLIFRLLVIGGFDRRMVTSEKPFPADWKVGEIYDLGVQIDAVAQDGCSPCLDEEQH